MLQEDPESSKAAFLYEKFMTTLIFLSVNFTLVMSADSPFLTLHNWRIVEMTVECVFALELLTRFLTSPSKGNFVYSIYTLVDICAILPLAFRLVTGFGDGSSHTIYVGVLFGIVPVLRMLKLIRHFQKLHLLVKAFERAFEALPAMIFLYAFLYLLFTSFVYFLEPRSNIATIPQAAWLTFISMTTVGYGDMTPDSTLGAVCIGILVVLTMLYMSIPLGIIGNAFSEVWNDRDRILLTRKFRRRLLQWGYRGQDLPKIFQLFDRDCDGELNYQEFRRMIREMGLGRMTESRVLELFGIFDSDGGGAIDEKEFVRGLFPDDYHTIYMEGEGGEDTLSPLDAEGLRKQFAEARALSSLSNLC